jgi:hypothetical protein
MRPGPAKSTPQPGRLVAVVAAENQDQVIEIRRSDVCVSANLCWQISKSGPALFLQELLSCVKIAYFPIIFNLTIRMDYDREAHPARIRIDADPGAALGVP